MHQAATGPVSGDVSDTVRYTDFWEQMASAAVVRYRKRDESIALPSPTT
jgi:hypothetical protein